ncbi:TetR/AcrR family transcriptional regulator [Prescottella equi]|uniref:TetR/AcrR family transcriptional regulator n=1 Tax=Rhodococcus hoagii TaxID=43767 RepID=UPI001C768A74|nr:TetR/AcrR family transcriptional regulator [Prescottella equi]BCN58855.1 TetR family transcriptional regulator [Prescottella equi]
MTARRGRYSAGQETRVLLVETAERLFAQRGYDAVPLAEIRSAAGQHNASVIGYYFGSKEKLLEAVLEHRLPAVNAHRERMIGERRTADGRLTVRDALWCLVQPLADSVREGNHYVGLLDRLLDAEILGSVFGSADPTVTASGLAVDQALREALDDLRDEVRLQRIMMVYESALRTLARIARSSGSPDRGELSACIDAWVGLLRAPTSDETLRARAHS